MLYPAQKSLKNQSFYITKSYEKTPTEPLFSQLYKPRTLTLTRRKTCNRLQLLQIQSPRLKMLSFQSSSIAASLPTANTRLLYKQFGTVIVYFPQNKAFFSRSLNALLTSKEDSFSRTDYSSLYINYYILALSNKSIIRY